MGVDPARNLERLSSDGIDRIYPIRTFNVVCASTTSGTIIAASRVARSPKSESIERVYRRGYAPAIRIGSSTQSVAQK